jgi:uncharacterized iron-regulated membrane protein
VTSTKARATQQRALELAWPWGTRALAWTWAWAVTVELPMGWLSWPPAVVAWAWGTATACMLVCAGYMWAVALRLEADEARRETDDERAKRELAEKGGA